MTPSEILDDTLATWRRERPDLDFDAMGTSLRLAQLVSQASRWLEAVVAVHGVNLGEFDVLAALRRAGDGATLGPTALARVAMVSPSGMTSRLDRLEAAGLIVRRPDPDDRRGSLVALTAGGRTVADSAIEDVATSESEFFNVLNASDRKRLDRTLDLLIGNLELRG